jgi:hypothetical protein
MTKVNIMYDLEQDYLTDELHRRPTFPMNGPKNRSLKVSDRVFDIMLSEGLLRKTDDGYVFVGRYEDLPNKPKKHPHQKT